MSDEVRLALVGGGHAHIEVIRRFCEQPLPGVRLQVFDPNPHAIYSGMLPGFIAGMYERDELEIDLEALCAHPQIDFVPEAVSRIDAGDRQLHFESGAAIEFDLASIDIGSTLSGIDSPGVREFALTSRPISGLLSRIEGALEGTLGAPIHIVGAGAGGVELALCIDARLRAAQSAASAITLVTDASSVLHTASRALRRKVERTLERRGIRVLTGSPVTAVRPGSVEFSDGSSQDSALTVWVTGPAAHPLAAASNLARDEHGFARIHPTLQIEGHDDLFAVGDCASLPGMKKAGVYAVRSGPLLDHNLRAHLAGTALRTYTPQSDFLSLLNLGDGSAIGTKWGMALEGRILMQLKHRIDR
ncbi:MAG: FAD-dependent oxidoreductase, partial [Myxococcota bacterium]|nr:FAD-dependent oxidoreductase [Myxococcota bacterium]